MFIQLNGQIIYYEKTGEGSPVILAHGNGETHDIFSVLVPPLSESHTVYALDSRGHGLSSPVKEYHYADMAEDVAAFVQVLGLEKPAFYGFSDGGIVGLIAASRHPGLFSMLAVSGANLTPRGLKLPVRLKCRLRRFKKGGDPLSRLMAKEPRITKGDLSKIKIPVLVLAGSKDMVKKSETRRIASGIPNARHRILPGETHSSYVVKSPKLYPLLNAFFAEHEESLEWMF